MSTVLVENSYLVKITSLVISVNKPMLSKLFLGALGEMYTSSIRTDSIYNMWKAGLLDISAFKPILKSLIQSHRNDGTEYFEKQVEMLNGLKDLDLIKLMINRALLLYLSNPTIISSYFPNAIQSREKNDSRNIYLKRANELIFIYGLQSHATGFFESFSPVTAKNITEYCNLTQVDIHQIT